MGQSDRSLQQIRQETEQTRTELINTVQQLRNTVVDTSHDIRERIRPAAIKSEMTNYARTRGEQWLDNLKNAARDNPLQAVAIGGGLAYPLFRLVRAVPVPLLMIGAGLYLAGSRNEKTATEQLSSAGEGLRARAADMGDQLSDARASVSARAAELQETAAQKAADVTETVKGLADHAASAGQRYAEAARDVTQDAVRLVKQSASDVKGRASKTFTETLEQNPLAIAGVGLLIGGLIAGALPRTELEDGLLGEASRSIKRRAQSAASQGFDAAKDAAEEAARSAYSQAEEEGLHPDGMRETITDVGERVRRVAETAVTTAFEPPEENEQSNDQGASSHG